MSGSLVSRRWGSFRALRASATHSGLTRMCALADSTFRRAPRRSCFFPVNRAPLRGRRSNELERGASCWAS